MQDRVDWADRNTLSPGESGDQCTDNGHQLLLRDDCFLIWQ